MTRKTFLQAIPNVKTLKDFLQNRGKRYLPSDRDFSAAFGQQVMKGEKCLLQLSKVIFVHNVIHSSPFIQP